MANKIGVLESVQDWSGTPGRYVKRSVADLLIRRLIAERDPDFPHLIRMLDVADAPAAIAECAFWDGLLGTGNLIPFSKIQSRLLCPEKLHYPIPAVAARDRRTSVLENNYLPPDMLAALQGA